MVVINDLLTNVFNSILTIEKQTLKKGALKELTLSELHAIEAIGLSYKRSSQPFKYKCKYFNSKYEQVS